MNRHGIRRAIVVVVERLHRATTQPDEVLTAVGSDRMSGSNRGDAPGRSEEQVFAEIMEELYDLGIPGEPIDDAIIANARDYMKRDRCMELSRAGASEQDLELTRAAYDYVGGLVAAMFSGPRAGSVFPDLEDEPWSIEPGPAQPAPSGVAPSKNFSDDMARPHHYVFAHQMLPSTIEWPGSLAALVAEGRFGSTLRGLWDQFGSTLAPEERLSADGLDATAVDVGGTPGMLISLPPAQHWTEMYAALIAPLDPIGERRFFTLERQLDDGSGDPGTMVCEHHGDSHRNLGPGAAGTDHDAFISRVAQVIADAGTS